VVVGWCRWLGGQSGCTDGDHHGDEQGQDGWVDSRTRTIAVSWCEISLSGRALALAEDQGLGDFQVSLSHEADYAIAVVHATVFVETGRPETKGKFVTDESIIRGVLLEHAKISVDAETVLGEDDLYAAGLTSHASVNVMLALEDAFDIEFPDRLLRKATFSSVRAIADAVREVNVGSTP